VWFLALDGGSLGNFASFVPSAQWLRLGVSAARSNHRFCHPHLRSRFEPSKTVCTSEGRTDI
jgi:hypothetical protein